MFSELRFYLRKWRFQVSFEFRLKLVGVSSEFHLLYDFLYLTVTGEHHETIFILVAV